MFATGFLSLGFGLNLGLEFTAYLVFCAEKLGSHLVAAKLGSHLVAAGSSEKLGTRLAGLENRQELGMHLVLAAVRLVQSHPIAQYVPEAPVPGPLSSAKAAQSFAACMNMDIGLTARRAEIGMQRTASAGLVPHVLSHSASLQHSSTSAVPQPRFQA